MRSSHIARRWAAPWLLALSAVASGALAEPVTRGAMLSNSCAGCHGTHGYSPGEIPSIGGKSAAFIEQALKEFREGQRPATVMGVHARGYSDDEIKLIADHFAKQ